MSWAIGFDSNHNRDVGYGVPAWCDHPRCGKKIDRGLAYVCGSDPYGDPHGCGLFFCGNHLDTVKVKGDTRFVGLCSRCRNRKKPFQPKADCLEWIEHKATDPSWAKWRAEQAAELQEGAKP